MDYFGALQACESMNSTLVYIENDEEIDFLLSIISIKSRFFSRSPKIRFVQNALKIPFFRTPLIFGFFRNVLSGQKRLFLAATVIRFVPFISNIRVFLEYP
jgi:hypothetical protein